MIGYVKAGAKFSSDRRYRYDLWRIWREGGRRITFIGLNPSTANEISDDPTIRRCVGFAVKWGYGELHMMNLFAFISSNPRDLCYPNPDPIGEENDSYLKSVYPEIVVAWGSCGKLIDIIDLRVKIVLRMLADPYCFGRNKDGQPKHPLYLPLTSKLERY